MENNQETTELKKQTSPPGFSLLGLCSSCQVSCSILLQMASSVDIFQEVQPLCHHSLIYKEQKTCSSFSFQSEESQANTLNWRSVGHVPTRGSLVEERRYIKTDQGREL